MDFVRKGETRKIYTCADKAHVINLCKHMSMNLVPSRYTISTRVNGKGIVLYNSYTGAISVAESEEYKTILGILDKETVLAEKSSLANDLCDAGFLVPAGTDELLKAQALHNAVKSSKSIHLVIMPT